VGESLGLEGTKGGTLKQDVKQSQRIVRFKRGGFRKIRAAQSGEKRRGQQTGTSNDQRQRGIGAER